MPMKALERDGGNNELVSSSSSDDDDDDDNAHRLIDTDERELERGGAIPDN